MLFSGNLVFLEKELAASLIRLVGVLLDSPDGFASDMTKVLECIFIKALIWSVGSCVDSKGRQLFGDYLRMVMEDRGLEESEAHQDFLLKNRSWVARDRPIALLPPDDGRLIYDFRFDAKKGQWQPWLEAVSYFNGNSRGTTLCREIRSKNRSCKEIHLHIYVRNV